MAYIGAEPLPGQNREVDDISSSFNGSTTAFTLQVSSTNVSPESANNILVNLGGVIQNPGTDYTIAASTITFTTAPAAGLSFFGLILGAGINTATVADQTIGTSKVLDNAITADKLAHTSVTAGSYTTADITVDAQGRITAAASGTISGAEIADNAVTTAKINADAVTGAKIADDSINSEHYVDGSIDTVHIADDAVTTAKIADNAIVASSINATSVTTAKIADGAITDVKLANNSVATSKIPDDAVTSAKIADGTIATANIADQAITSLKIANGGIATIDIADGAVVGAKLADGSVVNAKIGDDAVTAAKIGAGACGTEQLAAGAVTAVKLASGVGGKVLQVVSATKTNTATNSTGSQATWDYNDSSLMVNITGASTSNKFLFIGQVTVAGARIHVALKDNSTSSVVTGMVATGHGSRRQATTGASGGSNDSHSSATVPIIGLISVPDTNAHSYYYQFSHTSGSTRTIRLNETESTGNDLERGRYISSLQVMEIAG